MENQTPAPVQAQSEPQISPKKSLFVLPPKLQEKLKIFKDKFNALPPTTKKMLTVVGIFFAIIFILLLIMLLFAPSKKTNIEATPAPTPVSVSPAPNIVTGSRYATDEGVLKIESNLNQIQKDLNNIDTRQTDLTQPSLDFDINFNTN